MTAIYEWQVRTEPGLKGWRGLQAATISAQVGTAFPLLNFNNECDCYGTKFTEDVVLAPTWVKGGVCCKHPVDTNATQGTRYKSQSLPTSQDPFKTAVVTAKIDHFLTVLFYVDENTFYYATWVQPPRNYQH